MITAPPDSRPPNKQALKKAFRGCAAEITKFTFYPYRAADRSIAMIQARADLRDGKKEFRRFTWDGSSWKLGGSSSERMPVFRLPEALARPDVPVLIVEGEKACLAAELILPHYTPVAPQLNADLDWMWNRNVIILPDNDEAGMIKAKKWHDILPDSVVLDPEWVNTEVFERPSEKGWDIADTKVGKYYYVPAMCCGGLAVISETMYCCSSACDFDKVEESLKELL